MLREKNFAICLRKFNFMFNNSQKKVAVAVQSPSERIMNFDEVELGYDRNSAIEEANRCLGCKAKPCVSNCPVRVDIPSFVSKIKENDPKGAYEIITQSNPFPAICGRVCPQEKQCESKCVRGKSGEPVAIGCLERYAADFGRDFSEKNINNKSSSFQHKIAVVGSGPAGLTCASELLKMGFKVTVFEALHEFGGVLAYGIPKFRLPRKILDHELDKLKKSGAEMVNNAVIGKSLRIDELFDMGYSAVYIATGAGLPKFMNIPGESLAGICSANEFLTRINLMNAHEEEYDTPLLNLGNVLVVGGGNVAMDAARCAIRSGAKSVKIMYRRSESEMPARLSEISHAKEEGVEFMLMSNPVEFCGDNGKVSGVKFQKMKFSETDESGRRSVEPISGEVHKINIDTAIIAIGNGSNPIVTGSDNTIKCDRHGRIIVGEDSVRTSRKFVYAGGDIVTGAATVILAMGAGKKAAREIFEDLSLEFNISKI